MLARIVLIAFVVLTVAGVGYLLLEEQGLGEGGAATGGPTVVPRPGTALPTSAPSTQLVEGSEDPAQLTPEQLPDAGGEAAQPLLGIRADGTVTGRVIDPSGASLPGVPVLLYVSEDPWQEELDSTELSVKLGGVRTDSEGAFELPARSGATHTLLAGGVNWARVRHDGVAASDQLIVSLVEPRMVEGVVREEESGDPIEGAYVLVIAGAESLSVETDGDGAFRVAPLPAENVFVAAWAPGFDVAFDGEVLAGWEPVTLELPPGRDVVGTVEDLETSLPVAGAQVRFRMDVIARVAAVGASPEIELREETVFEETLVTDADGVFAVSGVPSSGFVLDVEAEGYVPARLKRYEDRPLAEDEEISVSMRPQELVMGRVVSGVDLIRVPGAEVDLIAGEKVLVRSVADESGEFSLGVDAWDGQSSLLVTSRGQDGLAGTVRVRYRHVDEELLVHLAEPVPLRVRVTSGDTPLVSAQVSVQAGGGPEQPMLVNTGADGLAELLYPRSSPEVERLILQARHAGQQSLPVDVDLVGGPPDEVVTLDVQTGSWIEGLVADAFGTPIPGASVWTRRAVSVHSDFEGRFRLGPLEEGRRAKVTAVAPGFRESRVTIDELSPWMGELLITLEPIVLWKGTVTNSATGLPVDDYLARLQVEHESDAGPAYVDLGGKAGRTPGEPGAFTAELPAAGRYRMRILSLDYLKATSQVLDFDGVNEPPPVDIFLQPAALLRVTVLDSMERPLHGFAVRTVEVEEPKAPRLEQKARKNSPVQRTDSQGVARFNLNEGGVYRIASGSAGYIDPQQIRVSPGPMVEFTCRVPATGDLALTILDEMGDPVHRPRVSLRAVGRMRPYDVRRKSSPRGAPEEVIFDVLPPGTYSVRVRARGLETLEMQTVVQANRVQRERLVMRPEEERR